jgi:chemotaxis receptor (MCP) glutamine deamidase CheD
MATEKKTQYERLESKLFSLKQRLRDHSDIGDKKYKVVKEQLCKVSLQIEQQRKQREELFASKKREAQTMQARVH